MRTVTIGTTNVNLEHPAHNFKNLKDLRKNEVVFAHLEGDERAEAQSQLWEAINSYPHVLTEEDMAVNPELEEVANVGDEIFIPTEEIKEG